MKNSFKLVLLGFTLAAVLNACKNNAPSNASTDTYNSGSIVCVADESFAPILDQELYVFKSTDTQAKPQMVYRSESNAINYLLKDSSRFAFLSRPLNADEIQTLKSHELPTVVTKFATDGIAIIVNQASTDTTISVAEIKKMLNGQTKTDKTIVFDNPNSGLVRYLKVITGSKEFKQKNIYALKSNKDVINYVSQHQEAIGIVGYSWLDDPDSDYAAAAKKVKIIGVKDENSKTDPGQYFKPSQTTLALKQYPLTRNLYIVNCSGKKGLGLGFEHFILDDKGQRIILRSGLLPVLIPGREINIHSNKL